MKDDVTRQDIIGFFGGRDTIKMEEFYLKLFDIKSDGTKFDILKNRISLEQALHTFDGVPRDKLWLLW